MNHPYERLFQSFGLGPLVLNNRIIMTPMYTGYAHEDGTVSDLIIDHYREMAASGVALVITEHTCIDQKSGGTKRMLRADENRFIPELGRLAATIKEGGALAGCQINHLGRYAQAEPSLAPSDKVFSRRYFLTVFLSKPVCLAISLMLKPCEYKSRINSHSSVFSIIYDPRVFLKDWKLGNFNPAKMRKYSPALTCGDSAK